MAKRFRIGLNFFFDNTSNSGVVNYIYNIIAALNVLEDKKRPEIVVFYSNNAPIDFLRTINYPYAKFVELKRIPSGFWMQKINGLLRRLTSKNLYAEIKYFNKIDCLYPYFEFSDKFFEPVRNKIHWLVDFNNRAFPNHYSDGGAAMTAYQRSITSKKEKVVLSSGALLNELKSYYPEYQCNVQVMRFASTLPDLPAYEIQTVRKKFKIAGPFLMSPNQFWEHKNQIVVLDALALIRKNRPDLSFKVLFTGSLDVNRGKGLYIETLKNKLNEFELGDFVSFLGVVDRREQLLLMKDSLALLQPSLYEGWSTLVEEAKALNKFIILSDLPVHREQISENVVFFDPFNAEELAGKMILQIEQPAVIRPFDYSQNVKSYGETILKIFQ